ncbi:hypothetical protein F5B22DRAFT_652662 [Xylaria bambusicola]|uniref:uncharacterized protein n=1 Tax=Xylaria bambusicola TaxID=326684 RepID=UPI0020088A15|nr:uncharacterized protein F5B22DRAFT_652662 [Xylaria bambusicola]KAI0502854.1 hypothetical protein F5B22DRAFT_652662 [Xylaria bambusicola]
MQNWVYSFIFSTILQNIATKTGPADTKSNIENPNPVQHCQVDGCKFTSGSARGIIEHQKNMHLGKVCYWRLENGRYCGHEAESHGELYQHFNSIHLATNGQQGPPFQCQWPGSLAMTIPNGPSIPAEPPCTQMLQKKGSADRHAREHQHKIWKKVEELSAAMKKEEDE